MFTYVLTPVKGIVVGLKLLPLSGNLVNVNVICVKVSKSCSPFHCVQKMITGGKIVVEGTVT